MLQDQKKYYIHTGSGYYALSGTQNQTYYSLESFADEVVDEMGETFEQYFKYIIFSPPSLHRDTQSHNTYVYPGSNFLGNTLELERYTDLYQLHTHNWAVGGTSASSGFSGVKSFRITGEAIAPIKEGLPARTFEIQPEGLEPLNVPDPETDEAVFYEPVY